MKKDFNPLIESLKGKGLINPEDVIIIAQTKQNGMMLLFGAIGGAISAANVKYFIVAVSKTGIKCFTMNPRNMELTNDIYEFPFDKIKELRMGKSLGLYELRILTEDDVKFNMTTTSNIFGVKQEEMLEKAKEMLKEHIK